MIKLTVSTARLRLRALSAHDLAVFRTLYCDADTMRHIGRPSTPAQVMAGLHATIEAGQNPRGPWFLTIVRKRDGRTIGLCSLRSISVRKHSAEVGLMLVPSARRHGYATEALAVLIVAAFRALPIDTVWVQYQPANASAAHLCDSLGFAQGNGGRSRGAISGQCVRTMRRPPLREKSQQPTRGDSMSNIIGFLESAGRDAALRHATREQLLQAMQRDQIEPTSRDALLQPQRMAIDGLLSVRETMYCSNQAIKTPKQAPAKKRPAKAPPKKSPARKPVKKAPAKRSGKR